MNGTDLWSFCQIQYNYMDTENQAGTRGLKLAADKGLAVVVMEPLLGGRLADPPKDIREAMESFPVRRSPAEWALQWLWDQPEVSVVLSGMSTMAQVERESALCRSRRASAAFGAAEHELIARVSGTVSGAHCDSLYPVQLLHAVPEWRGYSRQLRLLQLCASVRRHGGGALQVPDFSH